MGLLFVFKIGVIGVCRLLVWVFFVLLVLMVLFRFKIFLREVEKLVYLDLYVEVVEFIYLLVL